MSVQQCITNKTIEVVDDIKIRTTITTSESVATPNKSRVYKGTSNHFTSISEKDIPTTSEEKELYYQ